MKKQLQKLSSILLCLVMLLGLLPTAALAAGEITQVELTLDVPAIGHTLDFTPTAGAGNYEITSVRWLKDWGEHGNMLCDVHHKVEPGEPYTVRIYINPKEGYSFADLDDVTVTVNGSTDGVTFTHNDLYTGIICSVAFDKLGYNVSFDANGGTGTMEQVTNVYPDYTLPACGFTPPEGKVFNGWTVGSSSGKWYAAGNTLDVNSDVTLYAKWADPTGRHKITFVNRTTDPYQTVEIIVSGGMYTLPEIEGIFESPSGYTFDKWEVSIDGKWQYFDPGKQISVTKNLEINATWKPIIIDYEKINEAILEVTLASGAEYKHGMLAGSLSVSLGKVEGTYDDPLPISLVSGGYGHGYWLSFEDMLLGTDALSTQGSYRLHVRIDIPEDRDVFIDPDGVKLTGPLGEIDVWKAEVIEGDYAFCFKLPIVPGTPLTADAVTFTLNGYAIDQTIPAVTVDSSTPNVSLLGSGYGIGNPYMIYEDYVDYDTRVTDPHAKFEKHQDYCLQIDYVLDAGYSFPDSFWDGSYLKKDKFKLAGFEDAVVTNVTKTSVSFRLPQLGTTAVESLSIILNGYEPGEITGNASLTVPECIELPNLDYSPYGRLYCYYDPEHGFGDDVDGDFGSIDGAVLEVGDQYPFLINFYPVDGYDYSDLKKENITLVTPYGTCTATRFRPSFTVNSYWLTFDLPKIGAEVTTYPVTVNGGTGSNGYAKGASVTITANAAPEGKQFKEWTGADDLTFTGGTSKTSATATFTMPAKAVTVTATYEDISATKTLNSIAITTPPAKAAYTAGETFDPTGMVVTATYSDGSTKAVTGYTYAPSGVLTTSDTAITVTYTEDGMTKTATQAITVNVTGDSGTGTGSTGSSGGGGGVSTYAITVKDTKNGEITFSHKSASAGTTVTLTVEADKGYALETLTVTDGSGKEVKVTEKNGKYTFKMPASKVTVTATFMDDNTMLNFFVDVPADAYYYDAVLWAVENGITSGTSTTTFSPNASCTRAQMATFLWHAAGSPDPVDKSNPFADVQADAYYAKAVQWAYEQGITGGTSTTAFSPDDPCTRAQMAMFLWRKAGSPTTLNGANPFTDVPENAYYAAAVQWAYDQKITSGTSTTTFSPDAECTRAQMVTFLYQNFGM